MRYAERVRKDPSQSLVADMAKSNREHFLKSQNESGTPALTGVRKIILLLFGLSFAVMIWGVSVARLVDGADVRALPGRVDHRGRDRPHG